MFSLLVFLISKTYAIEVQQGTLNLVIANRINALVATDSRATITKEGSRTFYDHSQKLFQITDDIVVTVAGYGSAAVPAAEQINYSSKPNNPSICR